MIVAITGAGGFVGGSLLRHLRSIGTDAIALVRPGTEVARPVRDLPDLAEVATGRIAVDLSAVDVLVHCAAIPQSRRYASAADRAHLFAVNAGATKVLAQQAAGEGVKRFVLLSSAKVNGETTQLDKAFSASDTPAPFDDYAKSKLEAERYLVSIGTSSAMETTIIRPPLVYGRGARGNFPQLIRLAAKGWPLPLGAVRNRRSMIAIDNLVDLIAVSLTHPAAAGQILMACDCEDLSTPELMARMARLQGARAWYPALPPTLLRAALGIVGLRGVADRLTGSLRVDGAATCQLLNWKPPLTIDEALQQTVSS